LRCEAIRQVIDVELAPIKVSTATVATTRVDLDAERGSIATTSILSSRDVGRFKTEAAMVFDALRIPYSLADDGASKE
jgi:hypothetical protein